MSKKKILNTILGSLLLLNVIFVPRSAFAETKQVEFLTIEKQQDIAVMFDFETEAVDITFISPSGEKKVPNGEDVLHSGGELWSTYRVVDAEPGDWSISYDLKSNSEIGYSIIEEDEDYDNEEFFDSSNEEIVEEENITTQTKEMLEEQSDTAIVKSDSFMKLIIPIAIVSLLVAVASVVIVLKQVSKKDNQ